MPEYVLIFLGLVGIFVDDALTSLWVELARGVPGGDVFLCGGIAMSFLRVQMEQFGPLHIFHLFENTHQFLHVVTIEGTEIADVHAFKDVLLMGDGTLDGVGEADNAVLAVIVQHSLAVQPA